MFSRDELIAVADRAISVPVSKWANRDTPDFMQQAAICLMYLKSGCNFEVITDDPLTETNEETIWLRITYPNFNTFDRNAPYATNTFYIPTQKKLDDDNGNW